MNKTIKILLIVVVLIFFGVPIFMYEYNLCPPPGPWPKPPWCEGGISFRDVSTPSPTPTITQVTQIATPTPIPTSTPSASVQLHGEKTDVFVGEDIIFKLSAVNKITKPVMAVQVILIPPSGMSVTSSEFATSGAGQYTTTYNLEPGAGKDIEVRIKTNQYGDFNVKGEIVYYYGGDKSTAEEHTLNLPIKVREISKTPEPTPQSPTLSLWVSLLIFGVSYRLIKRDLNR
ncbi:MAG: hypothetical protein PHU34_01040 [Candidatus Methanoperedens sp.]|nr:hypothetical protein [Candidatus Methanoperedens sp.]